MQDGIEEKKRKDFMSIKSEVVRDLARSSIFGVNPRNAGDDTKLYLVHF